jgi:hypothetical protein
LGLGSCFAEAGRWSDALALLTRALERVESHPGPLRRLALLRFQLARALWHEGDRSRSRTPGLAAVDALLQQAAAASGAKTIAHDYDTARIWWATVF